MPKIYLVYKKTATAPEKRTKIVQKSVPDITDYCQNTFQPPLFLNLAP